MAREASSLVKRNGNLEAFLARQLDRDQYERIRSHESCIVCSEKEKKAFKFVILSDEWIYLSENPPKKLSQTVHLKNIASIELKNDFAAFLSGAERENTQHIVVEYYVKDEKRRKSKKNEDGSPRTSQSLRRFSLSPRKEVPPQQSKKSTQSTTSRKTNSMKELGKKEKSRSHRQASLGAETLRDILENKNLAARKSSKRKKGVSNTAGKTSPTVSINTSRNLASTMLNRFSSSKFKNAQNLSRPLPNPREDFDENGDLLDKRKKAPLRLDYSVTGELKLAVESPSDDEESGEQTDDEDDTDDSEADYNDDLFTTPSSSKASLRPESVPKIKLHSNTDSDDPTTPRGSLSGDPSECDDDGDVSEEEERRIQQLHLYILNFTSPFLMLLRAAWNNFLIRGTLQKDPSYYDRTMCYTPRRALGTSCELDQLFNQMKHELLQTDPTNIEKVFILVNELKNASDRFFALKKLFWKSSDLFRFLVHQLQRYLPNSPHFQDKLDPEEYKELRADEFELVILVTDTLSMMFRETEVIPTRLQMLKSAQGKTLLDLLVVITCDADVPSTYLNRNLNNQPEEDECQSSTDTDLFKLAHEFTSSSTTLLAELIIIAHMANWGDTDGCFFNITWIVKVLQELGSTEKLITNIVDQTMKLIWPSRREFLEPCEAVLLYQQFTVIQTLMEYSKPLGDYIRNNFHEEFKYYIQAPVICDKLRSRYPITSDTLKLIEEVMGSVLKKKVSLGGYHHRPGKTA